MTLTNWLERLIGETQARLLGLLRRSNRTINALSGELQLTDNAVRTHVAALTRDGLVEQIGTQRDSGWKPARLYALTSEGEELFPKAYALVLGELVDQIHRTDGEHHAVEMLRAVGRRATAHLPMATTPAARVDAAVDAIRSIGGEFEVEQDASGWTLRGHGCPLSAVTAHHPEVCALAQAIVEQASGMTVTECCDRSGRPKCGFMLREENVA